MVSDATRHIRVLQTMAGADDGGAELFFTRLCLALRGSGVYQRVIIRENAKRAHLLRRGGIEPIQLPFGGRFDQTTKRKLKRHIQDFKPHIILSFMNRATVKCPPGDYVHIGRIGGYYDLKYYRHCDHLIGNTPDLVHYARDRGWPVDRVHYLPNFAEERNASPQSRDVLDTPEDAPLVFALGRFHTEKGFDVLLESIAQLPGYYLWLAGEGEQMGELRGQAGRLGIEKRVRFLSWRDDPGPLYAAADVVVVPSRHEPLGNVVIEAWAERVPVVAATSQGPSFLIRDRETGLLVPIEDPPAMAWAIEQAVENTDLAQRLVAEGRRAYTSDYSVEVVVERYVTLFQSVLSE